MRVRPPILRAPLWLLLSACYEDGSLFVHPATESAVRCVEAASECRGDLSATCREGAWAEQPCDLGCRDGRCNECVDGERRCVEGQSSAQCRAGQWVESACESGRCENGRCACEGEACGCEPGAARCAPSGRQVCGSDGRWVDERCDGTHRYCVDGGCVRCQPHTAVCLGEDASQTCSAEGEVDVTSCAHGCDAGSGLCRDDACAPGQTRCGSRFLVQACREDTRRFHDIEACDREAGEVCDEGTCLRSCDLAEQSLSAAGCRFFTAPVQSLVRGAAGTGRGPATYLHVINPDAEAPASVAVWQRGAIVEQLSVPPAAKRSVTVAGVQRIAAGSSQRLAALAVRLESNRPVYVVVHFDEAACFEDPCSGDADFLLPHHLLSEYGDRHRVLTQPVCNPHPGSYEPLTGGFTLVSTSDEATLVRLELTAPTAAGPNSEPPAYAAGPQTLTLLAGDAIHFRTGCGGSPGCPGGYVDGNDLTGSLIESDRPVAVFNGGISRVPCPAGHIQTQLLEQLMPVGLWGDDHVLVARNLPAQSLSGRHGDEQWVILTDTAGNELTFTPTPATGPPYAPLANPGSALTFNTSSGPYAGMRTARVQSSAPVLVARYLYTGPLGDTLGGATFALERPVAFWRSQYRLAAVGAESNRLLIVVPDGASLTIDGAPIQAARTPGPDGFGAFEGDVGAGLHSIESNAPVGILLYGYNGRSPANAYSYTGPVGFGDRLSP